MAAGFLHVSERMADPALSSGVTWTAANFVYFQGECHRTANITKVAHELCWEET